jgi:hypothetical protein
MPVQVSNLDMNVQRLSEGSHLDMIFFSRYGSPSLKNIYVH